MEKSRKCTALSYYDKAIDELYSINPYVNMIKSYCQEQEFKGEYYGLHNKQMLKLSEERNGYITMLTLISGKLSDIIDLNLSIERNFSTLQKYSDNCR